ncbi:hypothetical protein LWI28_000708 [Acer negundo]|uniref:Uncharacterized protein n=1 Tax=Acer negundo TaxID=4023 RepID=A0AAD5P1R1_ACENE|nr:hypothetical protein LWI28_000708 [Acer negundo]
MKPDLTVISYLPLFPKTHSLSHSQSITLSLSIFSPSLSLTSTKRSGNGEGGIGAVRSQSPGSRAEPQRVLRFGPISECGASP